MKALFCIAALFAAKVARADCQSDGIQFFPSPGSVVPSNSRFIIEGLGSAQQAVSALAGGQLVFKAADDVVTAKVLKGWRSEMNRTAVLVVPNHAFRPNKQYTLVLGPLANLPVLSESGDAPFWESGGASDDRAPHWRRKPAVSEGQYVYEGTRLTRFVRLTMEMEEQSPAYLVVTLQRSQGSTAQQTYIVPIRDGKATIGHDGCSGGFVFEDGMGYRATVVGYDVAGNVAGNVSPLEFQAPRPPRKK